MRGACWGAAAAAAAAVVRCLLCVCCCSPLQVWMQAGGDPAAAGVGADRGPLSRAVSTEHAPQQWLGRCARVPPGGECCFSAASACSLSGCCSTYSINKPPPWLQMEVSFDSMADFEGFLSSIPFQDHKAWTQRIASIVVDGSPVWQVGGQLKGLACSHLASRAQHLLGSAASLSRVRPPMFACMNCRCVCADPQEHTGDCRSSSRGCSGAGSTSAKQQPINTQAAGVH
jgi:hypothetical protein